MSQTNTDTWTTRTLLDWMTNSFEEHEIDSPRLISEMLLTHVFGGKRIDLYANANRRATEVERESLREYVKRTLDHEPVQYIVGEAWFFGMEYLVNSSTLIPRSCTETLVEQALLHCKKKEERTYKIADIGTGSGCIAITIAANCDNCQITATDISDEALQLARENAARHAVTDQLTFMQGDGVAALDSLGSYDILCSNPPYIPDSEMQHLAPNVSQWEPKLALSGGIDGLHIVKPLIETAPSFLCKDGVLLIEIASSIRNAVLEIANKTTGLRDVTILRDVHGDDRFLSAIKSD